MHCLRHFLNAFGVLLGQSEDLEDMPCMRDMKRLVDLSHFLTNLGDCIDRVDLSHR